MTSQRLGFISFAACFAAITILASSLGAAMQNDDRVEEAAIVEDAAPPATPIAADGPAYEVDRFDIDFLRENPRHPAREELLDIQVTLGETPLGYVAPREGVPAVTVRLADAAERETENYYASAVQTILESVRDELLARELIGIYIAPDPDQISPDGEDLRPEADRTLRLLITTGTVTQLRTLASGERVSERGPITPDERVNHRLHQRIRDNSPIQPHQEEEEQRDLLHRGELDRYLYHLSRHPGRRVDASVAAEDEPGTVALDYLVTENRPLTFYLQFSNTGTPSTDYWRQRFGFFHNQLTNADDILSFDYTTASFDTSHAVFAAYERPFDNDRIRWRVFGDWNEFTADEVGFFGDDFKGRSWSVGGEIIANIFQHRELFVDLVGGARFKNIRVDNATAGSRGEGDFVIPHFGARLERFTQWSSTQGSLMLELGFTDADSQDLQDLGRADPDSEWVALQWTFTQGVFLEPLLNRAAWEDPSTPESSTLAHEVVLGVQGQYAFDNRLIPQSQQTVGGLYTVRGYPQSVVAGDTVLIGTAEYRFHVPRAFEVTPEPGQLFGRTFRHAPQYVYGRPDWDLILKGFVDVGRTWQSDREPFESNETLVGAGIGAELHLRRNLNLRVDWGFALRELGDEVDRGANRVHIVATLLF